MMDWDLVFLYREGIDRPLSNFLFYRLMDACREEGCPVCRVEQENVERFLENQFYENVNSPKWRDKLRGSLGFCHEHAWLAVDRRLGDAPPERRDGIFERYYRAHTDNYQSGLGLGLYITRQIVELHGGTIAAELPDDGGARFVIRLPIA